MRAARREIYYSIGNSIILFQINSFEQDNSVFVPCFVYCPLVSLDETGKAHSGQIKTGKLLGWCLRGA